MAEPLFRLARADRLRIVELDAFTVIYHRASGMTHLLASPGPEILAILGEAGLSRAALTAQMSVDYDLLDFDERALTERLDELIASGLVTTA